MQTKTGSIWVDYGTKPNHQFFFFTYSLLLCSRYLGYEELVTRIQRKPQVPSCYNYGIAILTCAAYPTYSMRIRNAQVTIEMSFLYNFFQILITHMRPAWGHDEPSESQGGDKLICSLGFLRT